MNKAYILTVDLLLYVFKLRNEVLGSMVFCEGILLVTYGEYKKTTTNISGNSNCS